MVNAGSEHAFTKVGFVMPPLGPAYVAAYLRDAGHDVRMHDFTVDDTVPDYGSYDLVGISADTSRHGRALKIARDAKEAGASTVMGGPHVTFLDEESLSEPCLDFVIRGEGELTAVELADALVGGGPLDGIRGLSYRRDGAFVRNPGREPISDLDAMPFPARELLDMDRYRRAEMAKRKLTSIISSRGCPSGCRFCSSSRFSGRRWRARSVDSLMAEIRLVTGEYGFGGVAFLDDNLTLDPGRVIGLSKAVIDERLDIRWWCFSRVDTVVRNPEMVKWMGRSGCRYVFMGIESAHQSELDAYGKKSSPEKAREAVRILKKNGIETLGAYILGAPDETRQMVEDTIRYSVRLDTGAVQYTLLTPYPGTALYEDMHDRLLTNDWDMFDCTKPVVRSDHLSPEELRQLYARAYRKFFLRPKRVMISLMSTLRGRGVKLKVVKELIKGLNG
jgi:anaerobic magnesium-protoporphyrin IX monomethyl ester cyclase